MYIEILHCFRDAVRGKCPENGHDNALADWMLLVKKYFAKRNAMALEHPPYSLDLSLPDFFLFPGLINALKEQPITSTTKVTAKIDNSTDRDIEKWFPGKLPKTL
jgi:hypothetical protein